MLIIYDIFLISSKVKLLYLINHKPIIIIPWANHYHFFFFFVERQPFLYTMTITFNGILASRGVRGVVQCIWVIFSTALCGVV